MNDVGRAVILYSLLSFVSRPSYLSQPMFASALPTAIMRYSEVFVTLNVLLGCALAWTPGPVIHRPRSDKVFQLTPRQLPAEPVGIQSLTTPGGVTITYKEPGKEGVCETTPGVGSYAGYINLAPDVHAFVC